MVRVGSLEAVAQSDGDVALEADLDFDASNFDVVVLTAKGHTPVEQSLLIGRVPLFNRMYTAARTAAAADARSWSIQDLASEAASIE